MAQVRPLIPEIQKLGAAVAFVGVGQPWMAQGFDDEYRLRETGAQVFTDPELVSFKALGLKRGLFATLGPASWAESWRVFRAGHRQTRTQGDPLQQGGAVIVRDGNITFKHVDDNPGDHVDLEALLSALRKLKS